MEGWAYDLLVSFLLVAVPSLVLLVTQFFAPLREFMLNWLRLGWIGCGLGIDLRIGSADVRL